MPQRRSTLMDPPVEDLLDKVDSKFTLVALSAKRARQINSYYNQLGEGLGFVVPPQVTSVSGKPLTIAFEEVAAGKATYHRIDPTEVDEEVVEGEATSPAPAPSSRRSPESSLRRSSPRSPKRSAPTSRRPASSRRECLPATSPGSSDRDPQAPPRARPSSWASPVASPPTRRSRCVVGSLTPVCTSFPF